MTLEAFPTNSASMNLPRALGGAPFPYENGGIATTQRRVFTWVVFDLFHEGHARPLRRTKEHGD